MHTLARLSSVFLTFVTCSQINAAPPAYVPTDLGLLPGSTYIFVSDLNINNDVVGRCVFADGHFRGFLWRNGVMAQLATLGGNNCRASFLPSKTTLAISGSRQPRPTPPVDGRGPVACCTTRVPHSVGQSARSGALVSMSNTRPTQFPEESKTAPYSTVSERTHPPSEGNHLPCGNCPSLVVAVL